MLVFGKPLVITLISPTSYLQSYSVRKIDGEKGNNTTMYMTLTFAGVALMVAMIVGMIIVRKKNGRHPHHQVYSLTLLHKHPIKQLYNGQRGDKQIKKQNYNLIWQMIVAEDQYFDSEIFTFSSKKRATRS